MEENLTYFDMAENDYNYLKEDFANGRVSNVICYVSQGICERYLKHVIEISHGGVNTTDVFRTCSLARLKKFISKNIKEFGCDWNTVLLADGYYFSTQYPGDNAFLADKDDIEICENAVSVVREAVLNYIQRNNGTNAAEDVKRNACVVNILSEF